MSALESARCARCGHIFDAHQTPGTECVAVTGSDPVYGERWCDCPAFVPPTEVEK